MIGENWPNRVTQLNIKNIISIEITNTILIWSWWCELKQQIMGKNHSNQNKNRFDAFPYKLIPVQSECYLPTTRKAFCSV